MVHIKINYSTEPSGYFDCIERWRTKYNIKCFEVYNGNNSNEEYQIFNNITMEQLKNLKLRIKITESKHSYIKYDNDAPFIVVHEDICNPWNED